MLAKSGETQVIRENTHFVCKCDSKSLVIFLKFDSSNLKLEKFKIRMGQKVSRNDFEWTNSEDRHKIRRVQILKKYPGKKELNFN